VQRKKWDQIQAPACLLRLLQSICSRFRRPFITLPRAFVARLPHGPLPLSARCHLLQKKSQRGSAET
jgi:hypothetical protein